MFTLSLFRRQTSLKARPAETDSTLEESLLSAIRLGDALRVEQILRSSPETAACKDKLGATPLHTAAARGSAAIAALLLAAGADVNALDVCGAAPLHYSILEWKPRGDRPAAGSRRRSACGRIGICDAHSGCAHERTE